MQRLRRVLSEPKPSEISLDDPVQHVALLVASRAKPATPFLAGVSGGVASGKSTFAERLVARLGRDGLSAQAISLDGYLKPNAVLQAAGLMHRKGFPESFDFVRLVADVEVLRAGKAVRVPVYDHGANDVVGAEVPVSAGGIFIFEGVVALAPEVAGHLDLKVFLDTDLDVARARYLARVQRVAALDASHPLNAVPPDQRLAVLEMVWVDVNLKNFREHIAPARDTADVVVRF